MNNLAKLIATTIIWIGFTTMVTIMMTSVTGPANNMDGAELFGVILVLGMAAGLGTMSVWASGVIGRRQEQEAQLAKAKRQHPDRVRRLIDELSDDEVYELEELLLSRDHVETARRARVRDG